MARILLICNTDVGKPGSVGERVGHVIRQLGRNNQVTVVARSCSISGPTISARTFRFAGFLAGSANRLRLHFLPKLNSKKIDLWLFELGVILKLKTIRRASFDAVFINETSPKICAALRRRGCNRIVLDLPIAPLRYRQTIRTELRQEISDVILKAWLSAETTMFSCVDHIIVPSSFVKTQVEEYDISGNKITVIPFGTLQKPLSDSTQKPRDGELRIAFSGVLNARKGIKYLLDAWDSLALENATLVLCGRRTKYFDLLIKNYDTSNIEILGHVDVYPQLKNADIYVFPSLMEGSSKSIYEAMACGLPVICTHESGSVVSHDLNGYIIPKQNSKVLAESIKRLASNEKLRYTMGETNKRDIQGYTWERYAQNVISTLIK